MQVTKTNKKKFIPITLQIVLESQAEVDCMAAIFNTCVNDVRKNASPVNINIDVLTNMQLELWHSINADSIWG